MGSVRQSIKEDGTGNMMRMNETPRDNGRQMSVGILGQMKRNAEAKKRPKDSSKSSTSHTSRKNQNSFKAFRPNGDDKSWLVCALASFFIIGLLVAGAIVGVKYSAIGGWSVFALGVVLMFCATVALCWIRRKRLDRNIALQDLEPPKFYHTDINDFPYDPVLQRGVTILFYHGQDDCHKCSLMRQSDDMHQKSTPPKETDEDHREVRRNANHSDRSSTVTPTTPSVDRTHRAKTPSHHVVVHQEGLAKRNVQQTNRTLHPDEEETSFIAPPSDNGQKEGRQTNDQLQTNQNNNGNITTTPYENGDVSAVVQSGSESSGEETSRNTGATVMSRDSILTTKKRRKARNRDWSSNRKTNDADVMVESSSDSSDKETTKPSENLAQGSEETRTYPLSRDSFLSIKRRKLQRVEEWERRRSQKSVKSSDLSELEET